MKEKYAEVIVDLKNSNVDTVYHYNIPDEMKGILLIGMRVRVPFGTRLIEGYVMDFTDNIDIAKDRIKSIKGITDEKPVLNKSMITLAKWMKDKYLCFLVDALQCIMPAGIRNKEISKKTEIIVKVAMEEAQIREHIKLLKKNAIRQLNILEVLLKQGDMKISCLLKQIGCSRAVVNRLVEKGLICIDENVVQRDPYHNRVFADYLKFIPTETQKKVIESIRNKVKDDKKFLIHGITGSGKTEVYMHLIEEELQGGRQAIVLVPEISLTPQMVERFKGRFGQKVAVLHSRLSIGERLDEWSKVQNQEVDIVVGARSAVFAPFDRLGLIIIDEEHENTYKSETKPRYCVVEVAEKRCEIEGAYLVLGSATPSIDTYYKAQIGEYVLCNMEERIENRSLPDVKVIDMKNEFANGNRSIFSQALQDEIKDKLEKKEQIILFLNKRGHASFVSCRKCGWVVQCKNCDISMTYHSHSNNLKCHYCGYDMKAPLICPDCSSKYIKYFGIGTQKIEEEIKKVFEDAMVLRMDADTTKKKGSHEQLLNIFKNKEADILIGTQMITKGLDFPNVTLVGVIAADLSLNLPDFRAAEKTFQLITQVAGRSGRGQKLGRVIVQTYKPEHYSVQSANTHDYIGFYKQEIVLRRELFYPPFVNLVNIIITGRENNKVIKSAYDFYRTLSNSLDLVSKEESHEQQFIRVLGPTPAAFTKIKNRYRWQMIIKTNCIDMLIKKLKQCNQIYYKEYKNDAIISIDINPRNML